MNKLKIECRLVRRSPGESVSIERPAIQIDVEVKLFFFGDNRGVEPCCGSQLIPAVVELVRVGGEILRSRIRRTGNVVEHRLGKTRLDGDIDGGEVDARPVRAERDVRGLGVEPEIEFMPRIVGELRIAGLRAQAAAHDDDALREFGEVRIDGDRKRNVGQRAGGIDRDLVRMRVNLPNQKVCGIFL